MSKRIIPISSGKGGVGKTSFAVNLSLCLARLGSTVLIDLDTGTSSVRNTIDTPVQKDLYHFFKKGASLSECITRLDPKLDPKGLYANFGFVAGPLHMIHDLVLMDTATREKMIDAINDLQADFVILDLKAGLDPGVIDFTPQSNSGILVFTPSHPAATLAAADLAKSIIYKNLRGLFGKGSPLYKHYPGIDPRMVNYMVDLSEDSYAPELPNLDSLVLALHRRHPNHAFVNMIYHLVRRFQVYYVLNRFDGVTHGFETAVKPMVEALTTHVSAKININNLGWIQDSKAYHEANSRGLPYLLDPNRPVQHTSAHLKTVDQQMEQLYQMAGLKKRRSELALDEQGPSAETIQNEQLVALERMQGLRGRETLDQNFEYLLSSIRYVFANKKINEFGAPKILKARELAPMLLARK